MKNLLLFIVTFFYFLPAVAETALQCQMYKQCTTIGDKGCTTDVDHNEDILVVINDEISFLTIKYDSIFDGKYVIKKEKNHYAGYGKINKLSNKDLEWWKKTMEKKSNNEITEKQANDIIIFGVFQGNLYKFYLDRILLTLKLRLIDDFNSNKSDKVVRDYKCTKTEKKI